MSLIPLPLRVRRAGAERLPLSYSRSGDAETVRTRVIPRTSRNRLPAAHSVIAQRRQSFATLSRSRVRAIFSLLTVAITSPFWKPSFLRQRTVRDIEHHHALVGGFEPQFVGERGRNIGDLHAHERRTRLG